METEQAMDNEEAVQSRVEDSDEDESDDESEDGDGDGDVSKPIRMLLSAMLLCITFGHSWCTVLRMCGGWQ